MADGRVQRRSVRVLGGRGTLLATFVGTFRGGGVVFVVFGVGVDAMEGYVGRDRTRRVVPFGASTTIQKSERMECYA